ncbi:MAG: PilZ domain-containing protein [Proteobacteria bacterium]|nr:PilZ domain-containing protein [Pseudomonadota bacterium]
MHKKEFRKFIRHPSDIPIKITAEHLENEITDHRLTNVSLGGLTFESDHNLDVGSIIRISIPYVNPAFETESRVVWCKQKAKFYEAGVEFLEINDAFKARLVEQICYIEHYRKEVLELEGRALTSEEAANEWIGKFAATFPSFTGEE